MAAIRTPCINVCILDETVGLCRGCGRTREEVAAWSAITAAERERIMAELPGRRAAAFPRAAVAAGRGA